MRISFDWTAVDQGTDEILANSATPQTTHIEMKLTINGEARDMLTAEDGKDVPLQNLLAELGFGEIPVLVEHNGLALRAKEHPDITVNDGDQLEIIRIVAGG